MGSMITPRAGHTATLLPNGDVLVAGGNPLYSVELYDPVTETFSAAGNLIAAVSTGTLLNDGKVLLAGGNPNFSVQNASEVYDPGTGTFTVAGNVWFGEGAPARHGPTRRRGSYRHSSSQRPREPFDPRPA